jgi:hypothetical protein
MQGRGYVALQDDTLGVPCSLRVWDRHSGQQALGIGVDGMVHKLIGLCRFHHMAQIHDCDPVRDMLDH